MDVAGQHDDERGPGFASPDQSDGCLTLKLDDGRLCKLVLVPQRVRLGGGRPSRSEGRRVRLAALPETELGRVHVDVALPAQLDGQADSALVQTDEDEGGFRDGLGRPMGGNEPGQLEQAAVAVAPGLALVDEMRSPKLFKPGQVSVGIGAQTERIAGSLHRRYVVAGVNQLHDLVGQLHQRDLGIAVAQQITHDRTLSHRLRRQPARTLTGSPKLLEDGLLRETGVPVRIVAAAHTDSLVEETRYDVESEVVCVLVLVLKRHD